MLRSVHLYGTLGDRHAALHRLDVSTAAEAIRALSVMLPGFGDDIRAGAWRLVRGQDLDNGLDLDLEAAGGFQLGRGELHIVPAVAGAKDGGATLKAVLGVALMGTAFAVGLGTPLLVGSLTTGMTWGNIAVLGAGLALTGVSSMLSPEEKTKDSEDSFTMSGPGNTFTQGGPVPLVYGETITGGVLLSGGLDVEKIAVSE